jgi:hypothetical protein
MRHHAPDLPGRTRHDPGRHRRHLIAIEVLAGSTRIDGIDAVQLRVIPKPAAGTPLRPNDLLGQEQNRRPAA